MKKFLKVASAFLVGVIMMCFAACSLNAPFSSLKLNDTQRCESCSLKMWEGNTPAATYSITPEGFDYDSLDSQGYHMRITVSYTVYYKKDYNVPFDIGYAGAPKYELTILTSDGMGNGLQNQTTTTGEKSKSFSVTIKINDLRDTKLTLTFSTDNVQNIIYFKNIQVSYLCTK